MKNQQHTTSAQNSFRAGLTEKKKKSSETDDDGKGDERSSQKRIEKGSKANVNISDGRGERFKSALCSFIASY